MACFLVPATEALAVTVAKKVTESKEAKKEKDGGDPSQTENRDKAELALTGSGRVPFSRKLKWLSNLLWGGSALLAFEHVWHGEVVPWFPFLTNAADPEDAAEMLHEMATAGVGMALLVTAVWGGMLIVSSVLERRAAKGPAAETEKGAQ